MENFTYYTPTKIIFGKDSENTIASLIKKTGGTKVLLHFGRKSARDSGLLQKVYTSLKEENLSWVELGGVVPNPRLSLVKEGIELSKKENVDFVLAIGGGSVIDSAKAICYGLSNDNDVWNFYEKTAVPTKFFPLGAILTIAAAGSEMSNSSVITNDIDKHEMVKKGYKNDLCRPLFAIMNPELTKGLNQYQTMCGCTDIIMHTLERWFSKDGLYSDLTDSIAEGLLSTVMEHALILKDDPLNYESRAEIMWAGTLSHNDLTGCGNGNGDWACHQLGHELSGMFDCTHGAALSSLWGSWARYVYKEHPERFAKFACNVMDVTPFQQEEGKDLFEDELSEAELNELALEGISALEDFFSSINMPITLNELEKEISNEDIEKLAVNCSYNKTRSIGQFKELSVDDMRAIYENARL